MVQRQSATSRRQAPRSSGHRRGGHPPPGSRRCTSWSPTRPAGEDCAFSIKYRRASDSDGLGTTWGAEGTSCIALEPQASGVYGDGIHPTPSTLT